MQYGKGMNEEQKDEEESLNDLPTSLQKDIDQGDNVLKDIESKGDQVLNANKKFKSRVTYALCVIIILFIITLSFYVFKRSLFIETVFPLIVSFIISLTIVFFSTISSLQISTDGTSWASFKGDFIYHFRRVSKYVDMQLATKEHKLEIEQFIDKNKFVLNKFGLLELPGVKGVIDKFNSASETESMWMEEISDELTHLDLLKSVYKLLFFEHASAKNEELFQGVKSDKEAFEFLKNLLIRNSIMKLYGEPIWKMETLDYVLRRSKVFDLEELRNNMRDIFSEISYSLGTANNVIKIYFPSKIVNDLHRSDPPSDFDKLDPYFINIIAKIYNCNEDVISYFFYSVSPSPNGLQTIQKLKDEAGFLEKVIRTLLDEEVISSNSSPSDLALILKDMPSLKPEELQRKISNYEGMLVLSREFKKFIIDIGGEVGDYEKSTKDVFEVCNSTQDKLRRTLEIANLVVKGFDIKMSEYLSKRVKKENSISQSLLLSYLFRSHDPLLLEACKSASSDDDAVGILYRYAILADTEGTSSGDIEKLILKAIENYPIEDSVGDRYLPIFKEKLSMGSLRTSIKELDSYVLGEIQKNVNDIKEKMSEFRQLDVFKRSLKDLFESTLVREKIQSLLEYGTVNAFMMTKDTMSEGKVWKLVEKIASENKIILGAKSGSNTRFGLLSRGTTFESFAKSFEEMYNKEVLKQENEKIYKSVTLYLYKFVPSRDFTAIVGVSRDSIFTEIGSLLKGDNVSQEEKISLLASLEGQADTKKSVREIIFNSVNNIDVVDFVVELSKKEKVKVSVLEDLSKEDKQNFSIDIRKKYSAKDLKTLYVQLYKDASKDDKISLEKFREEVYESMNRKNHTDEMNRAVEYLYKTLKNLGVVLSSI